MRGHGLCQVFAGLRGSRVEAAVLAALLENIATRVPQGQERSPFPLREAGSFDGDLIDQAVLVTPFMEDGERFCLIEIRDVSGTVGRERQLLEHAESLRARSYVDGLTGIANRRLLTERLREESERAKRYGRPLALVMLDIDRFKIINDDYGHDVGDRVLIEVVRVMESEIREHDLCGRWGGEEFLILMPECTAQMAQTVMGRLGASIAALGVRVNEDLLGVTASMGIAAVAAYTLGPGLGGFIFSGLSRLGGANAFESVVVGVVGVIVLAVVLDLVLVVIGRLTTSRGIRVR